MGMIAQQYHPIDITFKAESSVNPFYVEMKALFYGPEGKTIAVPGFYDGENEWKVRFSPTSVGIWDYTTYSPVEELNGIKGKVECIPNTNEEIHGGLMVDKYNPHHFRFEDGSHHYMLAYEADWLWALGFGDPDIVKIKELISSIKPFGFNGILVNTYAHDTRWCKGLVCDKDYGPPAMYAWGGTNEQPDHDQLNTEFFKNYDRMMFYLMEQGFIAHIFLKVYNKDVNWPVTYSKQDDLFFKYIVARYQAFPNVIWDFSKESKNEPDKDYVKNRMNFIKIWDGYHRLVTVHDDQVFYDDYEYRSTPDFVTLQQHSEFYSAALLERYKNNWPVFNSEFSYECGPGGLEDKTYGVSQAAEEVIHRTYEVAMSGAYPAYYYTYTAWDVIDYSYQPPGYKYIKIFYDFFTSIPWWKMEPHDEFTSREVRCLAIPGKEYVFYFPKGRRGRLTFQKMHTAEMVWMNVLTGERTVQKEPLQGFCASPFADAPSILHVKI